MFQRALNLELWKWKMSILSLTGVTLILKLKKTETQDLRLTERDSGVISLWAVLIAMLFVHVSDSAVVKSVHSGARLPGILSYFHHLLEKFQIPLYLILLTHKME